MTPQRHDVDTSLRQSLDWPCSPARMLEAMPTKPAAQSNLCRLRLAQLHPGPGRALRRALAAPSPTTSCGCCSTSSAAPSASSATPTPFPSPRWSPGSPPARAPSSTPAPAWPSPPSPAASRALREQGIIVATRNASPERGDEPTTYRLRFNTDATPEKSATTPVSQQQDTPRVSPTGQAVSQPRDTQETDPQKTAFESSKGMLWKESRRAGDYDKPDQTASHRDRSGSSIGREFHGHDAQAPHPPRCGRR